MKEISGLVRDAKVMFLKKWSQSTLSDVGDHSRIEHIDISMPQGPTCSNYYVVVELKYWKPHSERQIIYFQS